MHINHLVSQRSYSHAVCSCLYGKYLQKHSLIEEYTHLTLNPGTPFEPLIFRPEPAYAEVYTSLGDAVEQNKMDILLTR